jgi:hypothetical protein
MGSRDTSPNCASLPTRGGLSRDTGRRIAFDLVIRTEALIPKIAPRTRRIVVITRVAISSTMMLFAYVP